MGRILCRPYRLVWIMVIFPQGVALGSELPRLQRGSMNPFAGLVLFCPRSYRLPVINFHVFSQAIPLTVADSVTL